MSADGMMDALGGGGVRTQQGGDLRLRGRGHCGQGIAGEGARQHFQCLVGRHERGVVLGQPVDAMDHAVD